METLSAPAQKLLDYSRQRVGANDVMLALISHRGRFARLTLFAQDVQPTRRVDSILVLSVEALIAPGELWNFHRPRR